MQIGGEHEDYYYEDFCIYNDVFVHDPDGTLTIYGYPAETFPPTDFHTATQVGDFIDVIGSLGYKGTRRFGETPVYRLDLRTFAMERIETHGEMPGWIYKHRAIALPEYGIRIWSGKTAREIAGEESHWTSPGAFELDVETHQWRKAE